MDKLFVRIVIGGFALGIIIFLWLGVKVLGVFEIVDPDKNQIENIVIAPEGIIDVIKIKQDRHIRKSYREGDCYTWADFDDLKSSDKLGRIVENLNSNSHFLQMVLETNKLSAEEWGVLREEALATYQGTWDEIGKVGPDGQTQAGQEAQKLIANKIVDLVSKLRRQ